MAPAIGREGASTTMDNEGFRQHLMARGLGEEQIEGHLTAMVDFTHYLGNR
jgi:hypothetical protein